MLKHSVCVGERYVGTRGEEREKKRTRKNGQFTVFVLREKYGEEDITSINDNNNNNLTWR